MKIFKTFVIVAIVTFVLASCLNLSGCGEEKGYEENQLTKETEGLLYSMEGDTYTVTGYIGTETDVIIPEKHLDILVTRIGDEAFKNNTGLRRITIPNNVTSIGNSAFYGCSSLSSITVPDNVISIGDCTFYNCTGLSDATLGKNLRRIGEFLFYNCNGLMSISIPFVGDGGANTHFGFIFGARSYKENQRFVPPMLKTVVITGETLIESNTFRDCTGITSITIADSVTSIGAYAFVGCAGLTSITIPDSVTSIDSYAFSGCTGLTSIIYTGTVAQWNAFKNSSRFYDTGDYTIYCKDRNIPKS